MFVFFDGEGFEASLIQVPRSFGVMVCVPAHGVRVGEPAEEASHLMLCLGRTTKCQWLGIPQWAKIGSFSR